MEVKHRARVSLTLQVTTVDSVAVLSAYKKIPDTSVRSIRYELSYVNFTYANLRVSRLLRSLGSPEFKCPVFRGPVVPVT
jgi:hypothetical protein